MVVGVAVENAFGLRTIGFEGQSAFALIVDACEAVGHDVEQGLGYLPADEMHAHAVGLNYGCCAIKVDYQAGQIVSFAMNEPANGVVGAQQAECLAASYGFAEPEAPKVLVDWAILPRENANYYRPYGKVADANELSVGLEHTNKFSFGEVLGRVSYCTGKNPRMAAQETAFFTAAEG